MLDKSQLEHHIRVKIKSTNGVEFEQLFWRICKDHYPDLKNLQPYHDLGNDSYSVKDKTFFSCYGVEEGYRNSYTIKKIKTDYEKFVKNWKNKYTFEKWVFVTNKDLTGTPHQTILDLNNLNDGVTKESWGLEELVDFSLKLREQPLHTLFRIPEHNLYSSNQTIKLWTWKSEDETLNLDNQATLRYIWNNPEQGNIELALNTPSFEDEKPVGGTQINYGGGKFKIGDQMNKGQFRIQNMVFKPYNKTIKFDGIRNKQQLIRVRNRYFVVSLERIRRVEKGKGSRSYEYYFLISETERP